MATARNTLAVAIKLDGTAEAKKGFEDLGKAGEKAFAAIARAADRIAPGLGARFTGAIRTMRNGLLQLQAAGARLAQSFSTFTLAANTFGRALQNSAKKIALVTTAIAGAVGAAGLFFKRSADNAEQITAQAEALGISAQAYQTFQAAVTNAGLSQEQFDQILGRFVTTSAEGAASAEDMAKAFRQVEVTLEDGSKKMISVRGTSEGLAKSLTDVAKGFRQVEITAEDGTKKLVNVRGTSEQLAKSLAGLGKGGGEQGLIAFAKKIESLGTAQQRLNAVIEFGFAKRAAPQAVRALLAIARDADPAARAINKVLEPLSDIELGALLQVDSAFDRLFLNILRIKDQIAAIFGPAVAELLNGLADAIFENQKAIREWAGTIAREAIVVVRDLFALLRGDDEAVQNKGLIAFRDTIIDIGVKVQNVFNSIIVPAFFLLLDTLDQVANVINSVFGTEISGEGLAVAAVILQVTGAFQVLLSVLALGLAALQLFGSALNILLVVLRPLAFALGFVGAALAALLGLPAAVGVAIVAAIAVAAAATFAYWEEIKAGVQAAWDFATLQVEAFANKTAEIFSAATLDAAWQAIRDGAQGAFDFAALQAQAFINTTRQILNAGGFLDGWISAFKVAFSTISDLAKTFADSLVRTISSAVSTILSKIKEALAALGRLTSKSSSTSGVAASSTGGIRGATGGAVFGPGTGTSDSIPAWLSNGEFIIKAATVRRLGLRFLHALNRGGTSLLSGMRGFADGGLVTAGGPSFELPRFSIGPVDDRGPALSQLQPVTFVLDGQTVGGFQATPSAVRELSKASVQKRVRSNGRKPGWYGGTQ